MKFVLLHLLERSVMNAMIKKKASSIFDKIPLENKDQDVDFHLKAVVKQITK